MGLIAATVLIPSQADLDHARWLLARAEIIERHRSARLARYEECLEALRRGDRDLAVSLAASQLNQIPVGKSPLEGFPKDALGGAVAGAGPASVFPSLEPDPMPLPPEPKRDTALYRLATGPYRLWVLAGGALLVLIGLMPASRPRAQAHEHAGSGVASGGTIGA